jgi:hypothetical protein
MVQQTVNGHTISVHHIQSTIRNTCLSQQLCQFHRCTRIFFTGFQNECVSTRQRNREHPHRNHRWEIKRGNPGHHPERLSKRITVHACTDLLGEFSFQYLRDSAGKLHDFQASNYLAKGVLQRFSMFGTDRCRKAFLLPLDKIPETKKNARSPNRRCPRPGAKSFGRSHDRLIKLGLFRESDSP